MIFLLFLKEPLMIFQLYHTCEYSDDNCIFYTTFSKFLIVDTKWKDKMERPAPEQAPES